MSELKRCPFCGKPAKWEKAYLRSGITRCSDYHCIGAFTHLSRSATVREWNSRPAEDALNKELIEQAANYENIICEYKRDVKQAVERIDTLTAEIERLKAALEKCRTLAIHINPRGIDKLKVIYEWMEEIERVADEALGTDTDVPANAPDTGKMEG